MPFASSPTQVQGHMQLHRNTPDIRTGSSSLTVFMELTSICLCSWCVSSCCLSSIIFDILVIPEKDEQTKHVNDVCCCDRGEQNRREHCNRGCLHICISTEGSLTHQSGSLLYKWVSSCKDKCEKSMVSDYLRLIMLQRTHNAIGLLPVMVKQPLHIAVCLPKDSDLSS